MVVQATANVIGLSSSANADDPVFPSAAYFIHGGDYWIPAYAGMTVLMAWNEPIGPAPRLTCPDVKSDLPAGSHVSSLPAKNISLPV
jgi:hypothetical protein